MNILLRRRLLGLKIKYMTALTETGIVTIRNDKPVPTPQQGSYCFRWGCTSSVDNGYKVVNKASAIHLVNDKLAFRRILDENNLCTKSFYSFDEIEQYTGDLSNGLIVRPSKHSRARHLYHATSPLELEDAIASCLEQDTGGWYANKYVKKSAEYRVFVANGRAVWVASKTPENPDAVAWNVAVGGVFENVRWGDWPLKVVKTAIEAHRLSGLDFSGVDIMVDEEGSVYVLEINSAPSQTSPYRQSCTAKAFDYIVRNGRDVIPLSENRGAWRKFIHPALSEEAWV